MVDISSQNNKINITVSSSGNTANTNVTPDYAQYYSEKSKEWAISNRIVDNIDYSSKYYANESKKQADISTAKATEVVESGNTAVSNIESARDNAIIDITNQENLSVDNVNTAGATQIANVNSAGTTQINLAKEQVTLATNQANIATEQATIATNKASEVVASGNNALSNIDTAKNNAITSITNQETTSKNVLIDEGATQIGLIQNEGATQVANVQSTGFYMRDDKLYYINSQGEEVEFKDASGIDEQLATKTDMLQASGAGMPSNRYINLALQASGTVYTAPANGYYQIAKNSTASGQYVLIGHQTDDGSTGINGVRLWSSAKDQSLVAMLPCKKGDKIVVAYTAGGNADWFRFIYAEGN